MASEKKCQRCGEDERWQEGIRMREASGPDAVVHLTLKGKNGTLSVGVCEECAVRLRELGWK